MLHGKGKGLYVASISGPGPYGLQHTCMERSGYMDSSMHTLQDMV